MRRKQRLRRGGLSEDARPAEDREENLISRWNNLPFIKLMEKQTAGTERQELQNRQVSVVLWYRHVESQGFTHSNGIKMASQTGQVQD